MCANPPEIVKSSWQIREVDGFEEGEGIGNRFRIIVYWIGLKRPNEGQRKKIEGHVGKGM